MRDGVEPEPLIHGGGQERGLRSGTLSPMRCASASARPRSWRRSARPRMRACPSSCGRGAGRRSARLDRQRQRRAALSRQPQHPPRRPRRRAAALRPARHRLLARLGLRQRLGPAEPRAARARLATARRARRSASASAATPRGRAGDACRGSTTPPRSQQGRRMTLVRFLKADGTLDKEVEAKPAAPARRRLGGAPAARGRVRRGDGLLDLPRDRRSPRGFRALPPASEEEEDLLDLAAHATPHLAARLPDHADRGRWRA
jgi:hypothetical protein